MPGWSLADLIKTLQAGLEPATPRLEVLCAIQLRHWSFPLSCLSVFLNQPTLASYPITFAHIVQRLRRLYFPGFKESKNIQR